LQQPLVVPVSIQHITDIRITQPIGNVYHFSTNTLQFIKQGEISY